MRRSSTVLLVCSVCVLAACADDNGRDDSGREPAVATVPADSLPESQLTTEVVANSTLTDTVPTTQEPDAPELFAVQSAWIAVALNGEPIVDGPVLRDLVGSGVPLPNRDGLIGGCALSAAEYGFTLSDGVLVVDEFATLDLDCTALTSEEQMEQLIAVVFSEPSVALTPDSIVLTDGETEIRFEPLQTS